MTMLPMELPAKTDFASPMARMLQQIALWQERRHQARAMRASLAEVPDPREMRVRRDPSMRSGSARSAGVMDLMIASMWAI